jgi:hypothetical protein
MRISIKIFGAHRLSPLDADGQRRDIREQRFSTAREPSR